jgi:hypothetical protein
MQQALASPVFRSFAIGGLLLALSVAGFAARPHHKRHLRLHAVAVPGEVYVSAWRNGDVTAPFEGDNLVPLTYHTLASANDGCRWLGTETLRPISKTRYAYRYEETLLECLPGATPFLKTPRSGTVSIER